VIRRCLILLAVTTVLAGSSLAADPHPFSVHDMLAMQRIGDPQVSHDGELVVFTVRETDLEANKGRSDLWLVTPDGHQSGRRRGHPDDPRAPRYRLLRDRPGAA